MSEFLKTYGALILAAYATVQVWIAFFWKKFFRKGRIKIHETGTIEVGYSNYGPTLGLNGTLRALFQDVFVGSIELTVTREKDRAEHTFKWLAFRPPQIDLTAQHPMNLEVPSGFMVTPDLPHRYSIVFNDADCLEEIRPVYNTYIAGWGKVAEELQKPVMRLHELTSPGEAAQKRGDIIAAFRKERVTVDTYSALQRLCYWEPGAYALTVKVVASDPNREFTKSFRFELSEDDSKALIGNVIPVLEIPISAQLQMENLPFHFAYAAYRG